jgi:hypothetical protein
MTLLLVEGFVPTWRRNGRETSDLSGFRSLLAKQAKISISTAPQTA